MMHLWGKVYLDFDFRTFLTHHRYVISEENGFPFDESSPLGKETLHGYATNLDVIIGKGREHETLTDFLEAVRDKQLELGEPVTIFADRKAYLQLATRWLKDIFPSAPLETVKHILHLHFKKEQVVAGIPGAGKGNDAAQLWYDQTKDDGLISAFFSVPTNQEFQAFFDIIADTVSIEYLLADFLADGKRTPAFLKTLHKFLTRRVMSEVYDWRRYVQVNIQNPRLMVQLDVPADALDLELVEAAHPFTNPRYWNKNGNFFESSSNPALLLDELSQEDIFDLQSLVKLLRRKHNAQTLTSIREEEELIVDLLPLLTQPELTAEQAREIIDDPRFAAHHLWAGDEIDKVNFFLVDKLLQSSNSSLKLR